MTFLPRAAVGTAVVSGAVGPAASPAPAPAVVVAPAAATTGAPAPARPRKRLATLDLMRGYYVGVLAAIHLDYVPSLLGLVDGRGALLTSEAEGFFMISGLLVGMLRRRDLERDGLVRMTLNSWKRALQLYLVAVPLTLLFTVVGRFAVHHGHSEVKGGLSMSWSPLTLLEQSLSLNYTYGWADFLTYYVPMFLVAPLAVWLLSKHLWPLVLAAAYYGYWLPSHQDTGWARPFLQWGVYFLIGAAAGYHREDLRRLMARFSPAWNAGIRISFVVVAVAIYAAGLVLLFRPGIADDSLAYVRLFQNGRLGMLRPLLAPVSVAGTYFLIRHFEEPLVRTVGKVLIPFGRNSLYVYVAQSFVVFLIPFAFRSQGYVLNSVLDFSVIALMWIGVRTKFLAFLIPKA
jgi:hypothetical protein